MWHKSIATLALCQLLPIAVQAQSGSTPATWPSDIDEMEDLMVLNSGYRSRGFADVVTPCTNSPIGGFRVAAGFVRTAFHDVAAHNANKRTNGLDGSIAFELEGSHKVHNTGPGFNATLTWVSQFYNSKASISDLLALGVYSAVRSCGGPQIGVKVGRIDATSGETNDNLPDAAEEIGILQARFQQMGFSPEQMIQLVACGHTLGGVHLGPSPDVANGADPAAVRAQGVLPFDTTDAGFDNNVVTEYLGGNTKNPLVVGPDRLNSDKRVFEQVPGDNKATIRKMADPNTFQATCQDVLQQMIDKVPRSSRLSGPIAVYDAKPGQLNLNVINDGAALAFSGEVRLRTSSIGSPSSVVISYKDRKGATKEIEATKAGEASGFDDSFEFWGFAAEVESIVSFNIVADSKTFTNNGKGFPVNDAAFVQVGSSSLSGSQLTVVVAVRAESKSAPQLSLSTISAPVYNSKLPTVVKSPVSAPKPVCSDAAWTYWTVTTKIDSSKKDATKLEVSLNGKVVDAFRDIGDLPSEGILPKCGSKSTTSSSMSSTSSSSSLSTSTQTSSTSLSSTLTSTSSTSLSSSSSTQTSTKTSSESTSSGSTSSGSSSTSKTSSVSGSTSQTSSGSSSTSKTSSVSGNTSKTSSSTSSDKSSSTTTSSSSKKVDATSASTTSSSKDPKSSTTSGEKGASTTTSGEKGASTTKSGEKDTSTTSTKETTKYEVPNWTFWNPAPSKPTHASYSDYPDGTDGGYDTTVVKSFTTYCPEPTKLVYNGHTYTVTKATTLTITDCPCTITVPGKGGKSGSPTGKPSRPSGGNGRKVRGNAGDILSSIYRDQANVPAPSGGIDGGKGRTKDLEMSITITYVEPTYTAPSYVNPIGQFKPTATAGDNWNTWGTAKVTATATATAAPSADNWQPANVGKPADGSKAADNGKPVASATKSGHVAKYTGAANALARGEAVMMGAAAVVGVVALVL